MWLLEASVVFSLILAAMYLSDLNVPLLQTGPGSVIITTQDCLLGLTLKNVKSSNKT